MFRNKFIRGAAIGFLAFSLLLSGLPSEALIHELSLYLRDRNVVDLMYRSLNDSNVIDRGLRSLMDPSVKEARAEGFNMQTGYYVGNGGSKQITGLGFSPQMILLKSNTNGGAGVILKTTAMPMMSSAYLGSATADSASPILLEDDGFMVSGTLANTVNDRNTWIAFSGSDCTASGNFCIGTYTGNGSSPRSINTGFQPDLVMVKAATVVAANWRSSAMGTNVGQYFMATNQTTDGSLYTTLDSSGFTVGATNNTNAVVYYYVAFKEVAGVIDVGTYGGTGTAKNVAGVGFLPNFVFTKNASATTPVSGIYNVTESYGNSSSYFADTANVVGGITDLNSDGFGVGTGATANSSGITYFYAAFGGASKAPPSSGSFVMARGTYTGNGRVTQIIDNLGFAPDLVIIKGDTAQAGVFRTRMMNADHSAYLDAATANITGAITALNPDGFTIGTSPSVNSNGVTYYWTAYGNAWNPEKNSGASDFYIGAYYGNGIDNRNITALPFQANMVAVKRNSTTGGTFRTSAHSGDNSSFFAATADTSNNIQSLTSDGFQIGTAANVNTAGSLYHYFGFKTGSNFAVGLYSGTGLAQDITTVGFQPDNVWVKQNTAVRGVFRHSSMATTNSIPFINVAGIANAVTAFVPGGFSVGTAAEANASGTDNYRYVAWRTNNTPTTPTYNIQTGYYIGNGGAKQITGLGFSPQMILLKSNSSAGAGAIFKTTAMPMMNSAYLGPATADLSNAILLEDDGFMVAATNSNTVNDRDTWIAFGGSNCTASGNFCVGVYAGDGAASQKIVTGFQPDLVIVKAATAVAANWRSSAMGTNVGQYFMNTNQNTDGSLFTTLDSDGFNVGLTNNTNATYYYYVAFRETAGAIDVGTYSGTGTAKNVTGVGFLPNFALTKNASAGTAISGIYNVTESYGNSSSYFTDTASVVGGITDLNSDGFGVGTNATANSSGITYYYAAFGGASKAPPSSGTFRIARGSYTGRGYLQTIDNLGFHPDLIIIKGDTAQAGVFRTRMMNADHSAYLDSATANLAGAITAINPDGFSVGTSATVNTDGVTYYWTAYGNAWNPEKNSGASDFYIGAYYGNGIDNRNITALPFQANMVAVKRNSTTGGTFRTSAHSGDNSSFFAATADAANNVQSLNSDGFQIGTAANVNTAASLYHYFGFKTGTNFAVGLYSGTGLAQDITTVGFQPDNLWVKQSTAVRGVSRHSSMATASSTPFINVAGIADAVTAFIPGGFSVGTAAEANASGTDNYRYVAWRLQDTAVITGGSTGSQIASIGAPSAGTYIGGAFTFSRSSGSANITSLTFTDTGTINASSNLSNLSVRYEQSGTCTYDGTETLFGTASSFSLEKAVVTGSMPVGTSPVCVYLTLDVSSGANADDTIALRLGQSTDVQVSSGSITGSFPLTLNSATVVTSGSLSVDIVDGSGNPVASPVMAMSPIGFSFVSQIATGTLGLETQKIRVDNASGNALWNLSASPTAGPTSLWSGSGRFYDFNDASGNGADGSDTDTYGGQLAIDPSIAAVTPKTGCNLTGFVLGGSAAYVEGTTESITLASTNSSAATGCYWDLTGIGINQTIPAEQGTDSYSINITLTITAT